MLLELWARKEAFIRCKNAATAIEYCLIVGGIAVVISAVVFSVGTEITTLMAGISVKLADVAPAA